MAMPPSITITAGGIPVPAMTQYGNITGRHSIKDRVNRFLGIPIGATTAGANRFKEPQAVEMSKYATSPLETITTKSCYQQNGAIWVGSEDCLYIDVICPVAAGSYSGMPMNPPPKSFPTHVWVYGGGFSIESFPLYQSMGDYYAGSMTTGRVVGAFPKYRVSNLGFLSHPALRNGISGNDYSGNWGVYDVLNGLRWVQNNIEYFGGDSGKVTINGESAGATLTSIVFASKLTYAGAYAVKGPLIHGYIGQSLWQVGGYGASYSGPIHDTFADFVIFLAGCYTDMESSKVTDIAVLTTIANCLRGSTTTGFDAMGMTAAQGLYLMYGFPYMNDGAFMATIDGVTGATGSGFMMGDQGIGYNPVVDGNSLTHAPIDVWKAGTNGCQKVHVLLGNNADEDALYTMQPVDPTNQVAWAANYGFFYAIYGFSDMNSDATLAALTNKAMAIPNGADVPLGNALPDYYSQVTDNLQWQVAAQTDGFFVVNHMIVLDALAKQAGRPANSLFKYVFAEPNRGDIADKMGSMMDIFGAPHTTELTYTWGYYAQGKNALASNFGTPGYFVYSAAELEMGETMKHYWANFIATGNPSLLSTSPDVADASVPTWKAQTDTDKNVMFFQATVPSGAMLNPCVMLTECKVEKGYDFRRSETIFWTSAFKTQPTHTYCEKVDIGFSHYGWATMYDKAKCLIPHGCAGWCNAWTSTMYNCESCQVSKDLKDGKLCQSWCNSYTGGFQACKGCK